MLNKINLPGMSHPYISVDGLEDDFRENFDNESLFLLKDIIRGLDSTSYIKIRNFMKNFVVPNTTGDKRALTHWVTKYILNSSPNKSTLKCMRDFLLISPEKVTIIENECRKYDEILGKVITHKHFQEAHKWLLDNYQKPDEKDIAFFTTCASVKPYSNSPNFSIILNHLKRELKDPKKVHWLVLSNATAPIPEEFHSTFPFYAYETDITQLNKEESKKYIRVTSKRLKKYLELNQYKHYVALLRPSSLQIQVLKKVEKKLDLNVVYLPKQETIDKINALGIGYWSRVGMKHRYTLSELTEEIKLLNS